MFKLFVTAAPSVMAAVAGDHVQSQPSVSGLSEYNRVFFYYNSLQKAQFFSVVLCLHMQFSRFPEYSMISVFT